MLILSISALGFECTSASHPTFTHITLGLVNQWLPIDIVGLVELSCMLVTSSDRELRMPMSRFLFGVPGVRASGSCRSRGSVVGQLREFSNQVFDHIRYSAVTCYADNTGDRARFPIVQDSSFAVLFLKNALPLYH